MQAERGIRVGTRRPGGDDLCTPRVRRANRQHKQHKAGHPGPSQVGRRLLPGRLRDETIHRGLARRGRYPGRRRLGHRQCGVGRRRFRRRLLWRHGGGGRLVRWLCGHLVRWRGGELLRRCTKNCHRRPLAIAACASHDASGCHQGVRAHRRLRSRTDRRFAYRKMVRERRLRGNGGTPSGMARMVAMIRFDEVGLRVRPCRPGRCHGGSRGAA